MAGGSLSRAPNTASGLPQGFRNTPRALELARICPFIGRRWRQRPRHQSLKCVAAGPSPAEKKGFHQRRLAADPKRRDENRVPLEVIVRDASSDAELLSTAHLRAQSFYVYPPERAFAGQLHQRVKAKEEFERLLEWHRSRESIDDFDQQGVCLVAVCNSGTLPEVPDWSRVADGDVVVGSLDICSTRTVAGEVLIGRSQKPAYLSNVCVLDAARRRNVGVGLLRAARQIARGWGVDDLYVHTMAVNEVARSFYEKHGFVLEKEESSNRAHYRGHCLDGIEGRGRTVLLRDGRLHAS